MPLSQYLKIYPDKVRPDHFLLFSTLRTSSAILSGDTLRRIQKGDESCSERDALQRLGMLVQDREAEKQSLRGILERVNSRSRSFNAIVVLNLDCNLDCGYCYEADFRGGHYMSDETADLVVETFTRDRISRGYDVTISFYGGEPLLSQDLIARISEPLLKAALSHGVKYSFTLVTNGTLLNRETAQTLVPLGLKGAKFTLDGPREIHDLERPYASGVGSFDIIVDNIAQSWDLVPIQLGGNFRERNYRHFPLLLDHLIARGITPEKLKHVQFTPVTPQAGCSDCGSGCASSDEPWLVEALLFLRGEIMRRGFATSRTSVSACVVELADNIVVDRTGALYKCPAFMGSPDLCVGTLADGIKEYGRSHAIGNWQVDACLDCCYLPLCFGGCRFLTLARGGSMEEVDCKRSFLDSSLEQILLQNMSHPQKSVKRAPSERPQSQSPLPSPPPA